MEMEMENEEEGDYKFLQIKDAISSLNQKVNIIGVVLEFGIPRQTTGTGMEKFLEGYPSVDVLKKKRNKLLGIAECDDGKEIEDAPRNPPWVQCCLKSYYLAESDVWGSRNYRIFGTKLVG